MGHYKSNVRDIEFNLFEVFGTDQVLGTGPFEDLDEDTARGMIAEVAKLAEGPLADSFADADRNPPVFDPDTNSVKIPESFKKSFKALYDSEWWRLETIPELGGQLAPRTVVWAVAEQVLGSNPALHMYMAGAPFAGILYLNGNDTQKKMAQRMVDKGWGSTMVLTEPDAGSDVGAGPHQGRPERRRLVEHRGRQALHHLGRAGHDREHRPPGAGPAGGRGRRHQGPVAVRGAEVPLRPRDGRAGRAQRRVRHQRRAQDGPQGLHHLRAALRREPRRPGQGLARRRRAQRHRADVPGHRARPHDGRHQGHRHPVHRLPQRPGLREDPHPVRRSHQVVGQERAARHDHQPPGRPPQPDDEQGLRRGHARARAVHVHRPGPHHHRRARRHRHRAGRRDQRPAAADRQGRGFERSYDQLAQALQTFGGSGYLQDYPLEQYIRDAKIDTLYEGTTAIQAQDFFFRKIVRNKGAALGALSGEVTQFLESIADEGRLKEESAALQKALEDFGGIVATMFTQLMSAQEDVDNLYKVGQNATRLLMSAGDLMVGYLLLRQASVALTKLDANGVSAADRAFYEGKPAVARFFAMTVLPELAARRAIAESIDNSLMDVPEASF